MERNHRNYEEGSVLRDLALAGVKIKIITTQESMATGMAIGVNPMLLVGKKVLDISSKSHVGIKRLGKIDFLINFCNGYIGVIHSK